MTTTPPMPRADKIALLVALVLPSLVTWAYFFKAESAGPAIQQGVFGAVKLLQFAFPLVWYLWKQQGQGLPPLTQLPAKPVQEIARGIAFGLTVAAAGWALYAYWLRDSGLFDQAGDQIREKVLGMGFDSPVKYGLLGSFYALCHSLLEEYYWRWFVFGQLRRCMSVWPAIAISSLGFMAHHVFVLGKFFGFDHWATWTFSLAVAFGGVVWAWTYERSQSLLGPWIGHLLVDAGIFCIGYDLIREVL